MGTFNPQSKKAFAYINSRQFGLKLAQPYGLGFGGDCKGNFRLWIDENLKAEG